MLKLNENQIWTLIDLIYPQSDNVAVNNALINVFCNGWSVYRSEANSDLPKNTLARKVNRIKEQISYIEKVISAR